MKDRPRRWTVWHMPLQTLVGDVPSSRSFDEYGEAVEYMACVVGTGRCRWAKMFRTEDEHDVRARWRHGEGWSDVAKAASALLLV